MAADVGDLKFVLVSHIEQKQILSLVEAAFQFFGLDLGYAHLFLLLWPQKQKTHLPVDLLAVGYEGFD